MLTNNRNSSSVPSLGLSKIVNITNNDKRSISNPKSRLMNTAISYFKNSSNN